MKRLTPYLLFYKDFALWSIGITSFLAFAEFQFLIIACTKVVLLFFLWHLLGHYSGKKSIDYIVSQSLPTTQFFGIIYIIDLIITTPFVMVLNEFI